MLNKTGKLLTESDASEEQMGPDGSGTWMTTLYVQIDKPGGRGQRSEPEGEIIQSKYRGIIERAIERLEGDVIAVADDAVLATFSPPEEATRGLRAAATLLAEVAGLNRRRLAQDLLPYRVGIGLDCGQIASGGARRHPRLLADLEHSIRRARQLSVLNCQTPFPAIFLSVSAVQRIGKINGYTIQNLGGVPVPDHPEPVAVYALMPGKGQTQDG